MLCPTTQPLPQPQPGPGAHAPPPPGPHPPPLPASRGMDPPAQPLRDAGSWEMRGRGTRSPRQRGTAACPVKASPARGSSPAIYWLALVAQTLLVAVEFHPLFALVLGDFRFASFLQGTHRDWSINIRVTVVMTRAVERSTAPVRKQMENRLFWEGDSRGRFLSPRRRRALPWEPYGP